MVDLKGGPERGDGVDKTGKRQSRNIRHLVQCAFFGKLRAAQAFREWFSHGWLWAARAPMG